MKKEKNNFTRAVEWLKTNGVVKNQEDMAERMGVAPNTISRNKHGSVKRPDDDTLRKFNEQFGSIINIDYLRGESKVMLVKDPATRKSAKQAGSSVPTDVPTSLIAAKDEIIAGLKRELAGKDETIDALKREAVAKETLISNLRQQVADLRANLEMEKGLSTGRLSSAPAEKHPRPRRPRQIP